MPLVVRAFPLQRPVEELKAFAAALSTKRASDAGAFYRRFGISHESWHLQDTKDGRHWVIGVTMIDNPTEAGKSYAESSAEFEGWFKAQVTRLSGVNPDEQPLGPATTQIFSWADEQRPGSNLCA